MEVGGEDFCHILIFCFMSMQASFLVFLFFFFFLVSIFSAFKELFRTKFPGTHQANRTRDFILTQFFIRNLWRTLELLSPTVGDTEALGDRFCFVLLLILAQINGNYKPSASDGITWFMWTQAPCVTRYMLPNMELILKREKGIRGILYGKQNKDCLAFMSAHFCSLFTCWNLTIWLTLGI